MLSFNYAPLRDFDEILQMSDFQENHFFSILFWKFWLFLTWCNEIGSDVYSSILANYTKLNIPKNVNKHVVLGCFLTIFIFFKNGQYRKSVKRWRQHVPKKWNSDMWGGPNSQKRVKTQLLRSRVRWKDHKRKYVVYKKMLGQNDPLGWSRVKNVCFAIFHVYHKKHSIP